MIAFFCSTPYQIILAIQIRRSLHQEEGADMFILDHFDGAAEVAQAVGDTGVFSGVQLVQSRAYLSTRPRPSVRRRLWRIFSYANYRRIVGAHFHFDNRKYDDAYFTFADELIQLALAELRRRNSRIRVHLFEDGSGGYYQRLRLGPVKRRAYQALGYDKRIGAYDDMLLLRPDLFFRETDIPIRRIPSIDVLDEAMRGIVNQIFATNNMVDIEERVIFLEQPLSDCRLNDAIATIVKNAVRRDWVVKMHPRSRSKQFDDHLVYSGGDVPWEVLCQNFDMSSKTIVSYFSTAAFTPKFVFGIEPRVVFLYRLAELGTFQNIPSDLNGMVDGLRASYADPSRVHTPGTLQEFREIVAQ